VYPYSPATVNHSHEYAAYIEYLSELQPSTQPLIITEFGLSVSQTGPGSWGYGGNTLIEQKEGIIHMYSSLLDGGANGACIFNYSDGWWKAGDPYTHNDGPEEWFGLIEYNNVSDKYGSERVAWETIKSYQSGIIFSPRNSKIYVNKVPVELFLNDNVDSVVVIFEQDSLLKIKADAIHLIDTIYFSEQGMSDYQLNFRFLDVNSQLVKEESITILVSENEVNLPDIQITSNPDIFSSPGSISVNFKVINNHIFSLGSEIDYVFYQHNGWEYGEKYSSTMNFIDNVSELNKNFTITNESYVVTFSAGFDINYGNFTKRIHSTKTMIKDGLTFSNLQNEVQHKDMLTIIPNPSKDYISIDESTFSNKTNFDSYSIINSSGALIVFEKPLIYKKIDVSKLKEGMYTLIVKSKLGKSYSGGFVKI